jgi:hypothetical protein
MPQELLMANGWRVMMSEMWECECCKWQGDVNEIRKELVHNETILEPEEWQWHCPSCDESVGLVKINYVYCAGCEDEIVQHEGDYCTECYTEECERHVDASRGH